MARIKCWHIYDGERPVGFVCDSSEEDAQSYANSVVSGAILSEVRKDVTKENGK